MSYEVKNEVEKSAERPLDISVQQIFITSCRLTSDDHSGGGKRDNATCRSQLIPDFA